MLDINQPRQQAQLLGSNFSPSKICFVVVRGSNLSALSH
jgi:hypothetical protein